MTKLVQADTPGPSLAERVAQLEAEVAELRAWKVRNGEAMRLAFGLDPENP